MDTRYGRFKWFSLVSLNHWGFLAQICVHSVMNFNHNLCATSYIIHYRIRNNEYETYVQNFVKVYIKMVIMQLISPQDTSVTMCNSSDRYRDSSDIKIPSTEDLNGNLWLMTRDCAQLFYRHFKHCIMNVLNNVHIKSYWGNATIPPTNKISTTW